MKVSIVYWSGTGNTEAMANAVAEGAKSLRREYGGKEGVQDAAAEIRALKGSGLRVICVFTGTDRELDNAREIYGRDLVRIPSIGWFADAVGKVIADSIREI